MLEHIEALRCLACGALTVKPRTGGGRKRPYRVFPALPLPDDLRVPTCGRCHVEYSDDSMNHALEQALSVAYLDRLRWLTGEALRGLKPHISQRRLELLTGLSQGYLSRLLAGKGNPSPTLVALLLLLANAPEKRLVELSRCWALASTEPLTEDKKWMKPNRRRPQSQTTSQTRKPNRNPSSDEDSPQ